MARNIKFSRDLCRSFHAHGSDKNIFQILDKVCGVSGGVGLKKEAGSEDQVTRRVREGWNAGSQKSFPWDSASRSASQSTASKSTSVRTHERHDGIGVDSYNNIRLLRSMEEHRGQNRMQRLPKKTNTSLEL